MNNNILKKIQALPPLDDTIIQIQRICTDKDSSLNDLVKVVEGDPMLTANILKSSNSPLYGFSKEIKNVSHAISLFGMATVRGFALSSAIKKNIKIDLSPYNIINSKVLDVSIAQSALSFNWISKVDRRMLDILVPAAFMMEVGKIIIANELTELDISEKFTSDMKNINTPEELSDLEKEAVGFSNEEITAMIFEQWNLESELVAAIRFSNEPQNAPDGLKDQTVALKIIKNIINVFGQFEDKQLALCLEMISKYEMDKEIFLNAISKVNQ